MLASTAIVIAAVAAAFNVAIVKRHLLHVGVESLTLHQMLWGTLGLGLIAGLRGEFEQWHFSADEQFIKATAAVLYLGVAGSALAFVLYYTLLKTLSASTLATITYITPLIAVFSGWLLLDESLSMRAVLGACAIFGGIAIVQLDHLIAKARRSMQTRQSLATDATPNSKLN
jgi:drug/metabolite transporter (DMT)-like permease